MLNVRKLTTTIILLLILVLTIVFSVRQTETQTEYSIEVRGYTWDHSTISVSIFPMENESWWEPSYINATLHGIAQWNGAIQEFASNHTEFSYLSRIRFVPTITREPTSGFNIYVGWIAECGNESTIGQSQSAIKSSCIMINNTVCLTAKAPSGHVMTEVDMQNIVVHELGHTLGLYHTNISDDVMYSVVDYRETVKPLSSLDLYALSTIFKWMTNSAEFTSSNQCSQDSLVTLPLSIVYYHFTITDENLPVSPPQNLIESVLELFLSPEILVAILIIVILLATAALILTRRKKPQFL